MKILRTASLGLNFTGSYKNGVLKYFVTIFVTILLPLECGVVSSAYLVTSSPTKKYRRYKYRIKEDLKLSLVGHPAASQ